MRKQITKLLAAALVLAQLCQPAAAAADTKGSTQKADTLRGVWIASVYNIDFPKSGTTTEQQKSQLISQLDQIQAAGLNAVFFQVRPTADALYQSSVYPWSNVLTGQYGQAPEPYYDPLQFVIDEGRKRGIEVHAWINPYRITVGSADSPSHDLDKLAVNSPARQHPDWVVKFADGRMYFDPGVPEVTQLIVSGVEELVRNYDIAGIHFDDYFYPHANVKDASGKTVSAPFDDSASYAKYGSGKALDEWRRDNTYQMVKTVYEKIKSIKPSVQFGVSPFGVWANQSDMPEGSATKAGYGSYTQQYADTRKWVKDGILDYIAPQIYWSIGYQPADYQVLLNWWCDVVKGTGVKLYVGHAAYKVGDSSPASWLDPQEIPNQVKLNRGTGVVEGSIFYGLSKISANTLGLAQSLRSLYVESAVTRGFQVTSPADQVTVSQDSIAFSGTADPGQTLQCNGQEIAVSQGGYFTYYTSLKPGSNQFQFTQNGQTITRTVYRKTAELTSQDAAKSILEGQSLVLTEGGTATVSYVAKRGSTVTAVIGGKQLELLPTLPDSESEMVTYSATFSVDSLTGSGLQSMGKPYYLVQNGGQTVQKDLPAELFVYGREKDLVATIKSDDVSVYSGPSSNNSKITVLTEGVTDKVVGESGSYYKLNMGGWVAKSKVETSRKILPDNQIGSISGFTGREETDISFEMPFYTPYQVNVTNSECKITFFNTQGIEAKTIASWHQLFGKMSFTQSGNNAVYTLSLKQYQRFYGYTVSYSGGRLHFVFQNPVKASGGDKPLTGITVQVDAGHGGSYPGAVGPAGTAAPIEKELTLAVATYLQRELEDRGAKVVMNRTGDQSLELEERQEITKRTKPDLSVSIHLNSVDSKLDPSKYAGLLALYTEEQSKNFATVVQQSMVKELNRKSEGVRQQSLAVCRVTTCPSILLELGYICNPAEYEYLADDANMRAQARAIANGIVEYLK